MHSPLFPFHVGQAPYVCASGNKRASYQWLNANRQAVATVSVVDGAFEGLLTADGLDVSRFLEAARAHFASTAPIVF